MFSCWNIYGEENLSFVIDQLLLVIEMAIGN
jgi:hypothetical protein